MYSCNHHVVCVPPNINLSQMGNDIFLKNAFVKENVIRFQFWLIESFPRKEKHRRPNILQRVEIIINRILCLMNDISNSLQRKSWIFTFCPDLWMFPNLFDGDDHYLMMSLNGLMMRTTILRCCWRFSHPEKWN